MASAPKISVLMSCFNAERYVAQSIESILAQTHKDFEYVMVDDGSTDATLGILKKYALSDGRLLVIEKANTGLADSLNVGLWRAKGEWVARLDADDIALPNRLEKQLSFVQTHSDTILVGSSCIEINKNGQPIKKHIYPSRHKALVRRLERIRPLFPHSSAMFQRAKAIQVGGYNTRFSRSQDCDLWARLSEAGRMACLPTPLIKLRKHGEMISLENNAKTQIAMGVGATVCHILRNRGVGDPSGSDGETWASFIDWLNSRLEAQEFLSMYSDMCTRKNGSNESGCSPVRVLMESNQPFRLLRERFFGSNIAISLAKEWITQTR